MPEIVWLYRPDAKFTFSFWRIFFLILAFINEDKISIKWKDTERGAHWDGNGEEANSKQTDWDGRCLYILLGKKTINGVDSGWFHLSN